MKMRIVALSEESEEYANLVSALGHKREVNVCKNGNQAIIEANGALEELTNVVRVIPDTIERTVHITGGE